MAKPAVMLKSIHNVTIICANDEKSTHFYTQVLGLKVLDENFRSKRNSYKLDLAAQWRPN